MKPFNIANVWAPDIQVYFVISAMFKLVHSLYPSVMCTVWIYALTDESAGMVCFISLCFRSNRRFYGNIRNLKLRTASAGSSVFSWNTESLLQLQSQSNRWQYYSSMLYVLLKAWGVWGMCTCEPSCEIDWVPVPLFGWRQQLSLILHLHKVRTSEK